MGGGEQEVKHTQSSPKVPKGFEGLAEALKMISQGLLGAPANLGPTGMDAPRTRPLVPNPSMGDLFSSPAYRMGAGRMGVSGSGSMASRAAPRMSTPRPRSFGDLFSLKMPAPSYNIGGPFLDSQKRLAEMSMAA